MQKCKITVLKREFCPDLAKEYVPFPDFGPCEMMKEGDAFITTGPFGNGCPKGFCAKQKQAVCCRPRHWLEAARCSDMMRYISPAAMTASIVSNDRQILNRGGFNDGHTGSDFYQKKYEEVS